MTLTRYEEDIIDRVKRHLDDYVGTGPNAPRRIKDAFSDIDASGDGKIVKKEFEKAMKSLKIECNPKEMDAIFEVIDRDSSGSIDYNEFLAVLGYSARGREGETKRAY